MLHKSADFEHFELRANARVPIVCCVHRASGTELDLCLQQPSALLTTALGFFLFGRVRLSAAGLAGVSGRLFFFLAPFFFWLLFFSSF